MRVKSRVMIILGSVAVVVALVLLIIPGSNPRDTTTQTEPAGEPSGDPLPIASPAAVEGAVSPESDAPTLDRALHSPDRASQPTPVSQEPAPAQDRPSDEYITEGFDRCATGGESHRFRAWVAADEYGRVSGHMQVTSMCSGRLPVIIRVLDGDLLLEERLFTAGELSAVTRRYYDEDGNLMAEYYQSSTTPDVALARTYSYDERGNRVSEEITGPDGLVEARATSSYDGDVIVESVTDRFDDTGELSERSTRHYQEGRLTLTETYRVEDDHVSYSENHYISEDEWMTYHDQDGDGVFEISAHPVSRSDSVVETVIQFDHDQDGVVDERKTTYADYSEFPPTEWTVVEYDLDGDGTFDERFEFEGDADVEELDRNP